MVAVVVTTGASPWLEETLSSLAAQHYEELSVLVLVTGDESDPTQRVGRILPEAFVRLLPGRPGYAAASNEALGMVEGATFFLLCHDDCVLDGDVVHNMVEESFRSNAGVVSPKFVNWDDPSVLLHVGMYCDKTGAVVDRIQDGEVDHGQHDAVRDVFVAPGGCVLIRADLWRELEGFDAGIVAMGEDLDLSWRSQVAGSRVVVAPAARVRHREAVASGLLPLTAAAAQENGRPRTLQALQRRHELRTVLKCYTWFHLIRVLPQAALLALGECVVAVLARDPQRARAVAGAWLWNGRHLAELRAPRRQLAAHRLFPDAEVRRLQLHGSARLSRYVSRLSHQGFEAANAVVASRAVPLLQHEKAERPALTDSVGAAFSEDADFDDLDDLGHLSGRDRSGAQGLRSFLSTGRQRSVAVVVAALVVVIGTRGLFFGALPTVGQLAPLLGWSSSWLHFFSGWQPSGVGTTAPASPAFGIVALGGTVLLGSMGLVQKVLLLGCLPLGAVGLSRFMRPLVSPRARVVATISYLGLPLPYAAVGTGRWDGLVTYAALPFIVARLARVAGMAPFDQVVGRGWRAGRSGQIAVLGRHPRRRHVVRSRPPADDAAVRGGDGPRFCPDGAAGAHRSRARRRRRRLRGGRVAVRSLGGGDPPGRPPRAGDLRSAHLPGVGAGLGRGDQVRRGPDGPISTGVAPDCRGRTPLVVGEGAPPGLGHPAVGDGVPVVGPRLRHHPRMDRQLHAVGDGRLGAGGDRRRRWHRTGDLVVRE